MATTAELHQALTVFVTFTAVGDARSGVVQAAEWLAVYGAAIFAPCLPDNVDVAAALRQLAAPVTKHSR